MRSGGQIGLYFETMNHPRPQLVHPQFGSPAGRKLIYFHGAPGAPQEAAFFDVAGKAQGVCVVALDRFALPASLQGDAYYRLLASQIQDLAGGQKVVLVGFSIGAFVALQTSRFLGGQVESLHLMSAAAPLEGGNFLPGMAGQRIFQLARVVPWVFSLLSAWQSVLARWFPKALFGMLFASAVGSDRRLADDAQFQMRLIGVLQACFRGKLRGDVRDVTSYVQPWSHTLSQVHCPVTVWHGTQDNWSPPAMADYLQAALPHCQQVHKLDGLSHYGCLLAAAPRICAEQSTLV